MSNNINITRVSSNSLRGGQQPQPGPGQYAKEHAADVSTPITESTTVKRQLAPLTRYDAERGTAVPIEAGAPSPEVEQPSPEASGAPASQERHAKWKEQQAAKKAEREQARTQKQVQAQAVASELIKKGDVAGAAQALGMSAADLITSITHGALGMPPTPAEEPKKLSPEEQRVADEAKFKEDRLKFEQEVREERQRRDVSAFVEKNIMPELQNAEKYEMIHQFDVPKIAAYVYDYMNQHYQETTVKNADGSVTPGEVLKASDVLETIEEQMYKEHVAGLERAKKIKKVSKYFAPAESEEDEPVELAPVDGVNDWARRATPAAQLRVQKAEPKPEPDLSISQEKPMDLSVQRRDPKQGQVPGRPANWRALSAAEKLRIIQREEEAEARRRK